MATDGRVDSTAPASVAYVAYDLHKGTKRAAFAVAKPELKQAWNGEDGIALVEECAILLALQEDGLSWEGRDLLWFVDNSVVLSTMCKGSSHSPSIDEAAATLHLLLARLRIRAWWEYVESKANWSDTLSRDLKDDWLLAQGFIIHEARLGPWPWAVESDDRWARASAL